MKAEEKKSVAAGLDVNRLMGRREAIAYLGRVPERGTPGLVIRSQKVWEFHPATYLAVTFGKLA